VVVPSLHGQPGKPLEAIGDGLGVAQLAKGRQRLEDRSLPIVEPAEADQGSAEGHQRIGSSHLGASRPVERDRLLEEASSALELLLVDVEDPEVVEPDRDPSLVTELALPGKTLGDELSCPGQIAE
jgi:hypothetical protein